MNEAAWSKVDEYFDSVLSLRDDVMERVLKASTAAGLPEINVTAAHGKLLQMLARSNGSRNVLEVGTLGGYSSIWMGRGLPVGGKLTTLELNPEFAKVAEKNIAMAGLEKVVEVRVGKAIENLPVLAAEKREPFDFVFIDADKPSNADYFEWAMKLSRRGTIIVVDNVVRDGKVTEAGSDDAGVKGARRVLEMMGREKRVEATAIQTVGAKGYDGFALALVTG